MKHKVVILCDAVGSGKTTALQEWVKQTPNALGFLSPVVNAKRMFQNIETGELIPMETENKDLEVGRFAFDSSNFKLVEDAIKQYFQQTTTEYLVIDEIGPLEIKKNLGFHELLLYLLKNISVSSPNLLLVVRNYVLEDFLIKYTFDNVIVLSVHEFKKKIG